MAGFKRVPAGNIIPPCPTTSVAASAPDTTHPMPASFIDQSKLPDSPGYTDWSEYEPD